MQPKAVIIDLEAIATATLVPWLKTHGYAGCVRSAASLLREDTPPDLTFVELLNPEQEGIETIMALRNRWPDLPIIAMCRSLRGVPATTLLDFAMGLGADAAVPKPLSFDAVDRGLRQALAARNVAARAKSDERQGLSRRASPRCVDDEGASTAELTPRRRRRAVAA